MQRFLVVFILLAAVAAGIGVYTGWLSFGPDGADRKSNITVVEPE